MAGPAQRAMGDRALSGHRTRHGFFVLRVAVATGILIISAITILAAARYSETRARAEMRQLSAETLAVQSEVLTGVLEKYRLLPPLLARQDDIAELFIDSRPDATRRALARRKAEEIVGLSGAQEVIFFTAGGEMIASARDVFGEGSTGRDALMKAARDAQLGRAAISLTTDNRAYAFSAGVRRMGELLGVVAVYVDFETIEATWSLSANPIFVSDQGGIVFLTNRPEWRLKPMGEVLASSSEGVRLRSASADFLDLWRDLPLLDWRLHVLGDVAPVYEARFLGGAIAGLVCLVAAMLALFLLFRRELAIGRQRRDRATGLRLERIIRDRTKALSNTNLSLSHEIEVRRTAEEKLKATQAELVQTAKLAVVGQMSAALSHELNQPLAALRTYAHTTERLLAAGRVEPARDNLTRMGGLVDRMAELSSTLLTFSRKPGTSINVIRLGQVLDEAFILVSPRAKAAGVALELDPALRDLEVMGGRIRLSQVFVNLINNSIDALAEIENGRIEITLEEDGPTVAILVCDNGPGIPEAARASIFDPFFTTKGVGSGIGMGLSIAFNIVHDFGGRIELVDRARTGCAFLVTLSAAHGAAMAGRAAE